MWWAGEPLWDLQEGERRGSEAELHGERQKTEEVLGAAAYWWTGSYGVQTICSRAEGVLL
jgi:hypothetical protein